MKPYVIGTREDVVGLALAGVDGEVCESKSDADRAIARLEADDIAIVSKEFAECDKGPHLYVVLPSR